MVTPPEEIERQHVEACQLVYNGMPCIERRSVNLGEIPLTQKQNPTHPNKVEQEKEQEKEDHRLQPQEQPQQQQNRCDVICVSSRGQADVSVLQDLVQEGHDQCQGALLTSTANKNKKIKSKPSTTNMTPKQLHSPTNLWDPANAAANNVCITRPSHDAWGIGKIVLVFCDDFLQTVYELPWWHQTATAAFTSATVTTSTSASPSTPASTSTSTSTSNARWDFQHAVQPILEILQVPKHRIVRLLLASLPPGVTIPIHCDSGEWVRHTHRVHVPIIVHNPDEILFRCGPSPEQLQRIDVMPGHVFEMNNQAQHAVSNCSSAADNHYRVHLILDYVDESFKINRRFALAPGETLLQTRRSVDRLLDKGSRPTPSFMILGAQKAGTTSLYEYMVQHPLVIRAKRRETHCLDWRWNTALPDDDHDANRNHCLSFYHAKELQFHPSCLTGDSTPSYLLDSKRVIPRLQSVFSHCGMKFFVMLRNPVHRAYSHYQMVTSTEGTPEQLKVRGSEWRSLTFDQVVKQELQQLSDCGLIPYWNCSDVENRTVDMDCFSKFSGSPEEAEAWNRFQDTIPLHTGSHSLLARGLYELQLRPWMTHFNKDDFLLLTLEEDLKTIDRTMQRVWTHLNNIPPYQVQDSAPRNVRNYSSSLMSAETKQLLTRFYAPHNDKLNELCGIRIAGA